MMETTAGRERDVLVQIQEGMPVYDRDDRRLGSVHRVQLRDTNDPIDVREEQLDARDEDRGMHAPVTAVWTPLEVFRDALTVESAASEELRWHLQREGFIEIAGWPFHPRRYATPREIERVADGNVILAVPGHKLVQG